MRQGVSKIAALAAALLLLLLLPAGAAQAAETGRVQAPEGARVYFISPQDGETVKSPVTVRMGLEGLEAVAVSVDRPGTGHHHLLVDLDVSAVDLDKSLPFTEQTRHFGGGQTEGTFELKPGTHTLQLLFMNARHVSFDPPLVSEKITITVK
jgi:hypothetical protein